MAPPGGTTAEWRGVELTILEFGILEPEIFDEVVADYSTGAAFTLGDFHAIFLSTSREAVVAAVHAAIDRAIGQTSDAGFAGTDTIRDARDGSARQLELFVDIGQIMAATREEEPLDAGEQFVYDELMRIPWIYMGASFGDDGALSASFGIGIPSDGLVRDVLEQFQPASTDLLRLAPLDSIAVTGVSLDVAGLWQVVIETMERLAPDAHEMLVQTLDKLEQENGVDIVGGILENVTGEFVSFEDRIDEPDEQTLATIVVLEGATTLLFRLRSGELFSETLDGLLAVSGTESMIELDDFEDTDVFSLREDLGSSFARAVTDGLLIASYDRAPIERVLRTLDDEDVPSILDNKAFAGALAELDGACYFVISDVGQMLHFVLDALSAGGGLDVDAMMFEGLIDEYFEGLTTTTARLEAKAFRWSIEGM